MDARFYDPGVGRFIQPDVFNFANLALPPNARHELLQYTGLQTENLLLDPSQQMRYGYVSGNPLRWNDPLGLRAEGGKEALGPIQMSKQELNTRLLAGRIKSGTPFPEPLQMGNPLRMGIAKTFSSFLGKVVSKAKSFFSKTTPKQQKTIDKLIKQKKAHKQKLKDYKKDPYKYDNKGHLSNAPNPQKVIEGRIKHLENEIKNFDKMIDNVLKK